MTYNPPIRKPICPTFIHDDTTRIIVFIIAIIICFYLFIKQMRYYNE